jgi:hypothetical protein
LRAEWYASDRSPAGDGEQRHRTVDERAGPEPGLSRDYNVEIMLRG